MNLALETERLRLRLYRDDDIAELVPLIGARQVAATTLRIPHPYTAEHARDYVDKAKTDCDGRFAGP